MWPVFELKTPEATFTRDIDGHFSIDCACGGKDGKYSGSHYKNANEVAERVTGRYIPSHNKAKLEHTFYLNEILLKSALKYHQRHEGTPLVVVCNDCEREFPFTEQSYRDLDSRLMEQGTRVAEKTNSSKPRKHK